MNYDTVSEGEGNRFAPPSQGGAQEGDGIFVGVVLNLPYRKINGTLKISA